VAHFLRPGGSLYLAEGHPAALVLDDTVPAPGGKPGFTLPYFQRDPFVFDDPTDYADRSARLANSATVQWIHALGAVVTALIAAGLRLDWLHEHDAVTWRMFACLTEGRDGLYRPGCRCPTRCAPPVPTPDRSAQPDPQRQRPALAGWDQHEVGFVEKLAGEIRRAGATVPGLDAHEVAALA
jgi:hypothetical protein